MRRWTATAAGSWPATPSSRSTGRPTTSRRCRTGGSASGRSSAPTSGELRGGEVGPVLGVLVEPRRRGPHARLVLLVDELVDRALEPAPRQLRQVVALLEVQPGMARVQGFEA